MDAQPVQVALLAVASVAAGFLNVVAGGGSLLTVPALIFLGMPETVANGTTRVAILVQNLTAVLAYARAGRLSMRLVWRMLPPLLLGAFAGAFWGSRMPDAQFRDWLGWVMLGCALLVIVQPRLQAWLQGSVQVRLDAWRLWPTLLVIGVYGGLIQAGIGFVVLTLLPLALGISLLDANILKVVLAFAYTPLALAVFGWHGKIDLLWGIVLAVGQSVGAWLGARAALRHGSGLIRLMVAGTALVSALALLGLL